jgi:ATP-dependent helicase/DNAse subunit B
MSIKIFYIPFKYKGSTENLLRSAIEKINSTDYSKLLYIAPTHRKIKDSQRTFHRLATLDNKPLTGLTGGCYIPPEMMTINQFSKRVYSLYEDRKIISLSLLPIIISKLSEKGIGFASIISNFINEIKQHHTAKDIETVSDEITASLHELGIPEEITVRIIEALRIFKAYQELLNEHSAVDENDVMAACPDLIKRHNSRYSIVILDGFYELTGCEETIIKALIENAEDILISIPYDENYTHITDDYVNFIKNSFRTEEVYLNNGKKSSELFYNPYPGIEEEIEGIARNIKNNFISGETTDLEKITAIFPMLHKYADMLSRIFRRYGIPYTFSTLKPAGKTRPFLDLIALLESVADDYPRLSFSRCLISPYFKNMPSAFRKCIPRICLRSGIVKGKDAWLNLFKSEIRKDNRFPGIEKEFRWVFKKLAPLESIKNKGNYQQYSETIINLLNDLDFSDISSPGIESYRQDMDLKEHALKILKELSFIDDLTIYASPKAPLTLRHFIDAMKHLLNATEIEVEGTGIQVAGFTEIKGIEPEYLYFGGLRDGDLPSKPDIDHILPDSARTRYGLENLNKYLLLQKFAFYRTIESAKNLRLSYPVMEGDKFFLPSPFLPWNKELKHRVYGIFSKEEELIMKGRMPLSSHITDIEGIENKLIKNKFGQDSYIRITDIDSYRTCPRKFFIEKVLKLEPSEIKEYEVEAAMLGTIAHEIMQALISTPFADLDNLVVKAEAIINKLISDKPLEDYWKKVVKDTFISMLPDIYKLESKLKDEGYSFMGAEVPVEGEIIKGIKLRGKVDRVDKKVQSPSATADKVQGSKDSKPATRHPSLVTDEVELIDYKTGTTQLSGPRIITKGASLQLFLYAILMESIGVKVERVGIYSLKNVTLSWIPGRNDRKNGRTMQDYTETSLRFLEETVLKLRSGDFSASPLNEQTCRNCPERPYCPYIQKTAVS